MTPTTPPAVSEAMRDAAARCECGAEIDANAVFEPGVCDPCSARRFNEEAAAHREPAPQPIPVRGRFYMICCEHCDWVGSSEQCGTDAGQDDSDVYCPVCCQSMLCEEPGEADAAKHGQAVFDRIENQASEIARLTGERDAAQNLAYDLKYAAAGGEDVPLAAHAVTVADVNRWRDEAWRRTDALDRALSQAEARAEAAEADLTRMRAENARLSAALEDAADALGWAASALREDSNDAAAGVTSSAAKAACAALSNQEQTDA